MPRREVFDDPELGPLTRDRLTRDVWVLQRAKGHRFSSDDVVTAFVAAAEAPDARRVLDLGCGLGSVLLHLAWSMPAATLVGVEAQAVSHALLVRNVAASGFAERVRVLRGDLRDEAVVASLGGPFDLVTGTPPYFPDGAALAADDEQRTRARIETRGGVEAYLETAARVLGEGPLVLCGDSRAEPRVDGAAPSLGLEVRGRTRVVPKAGKAPLFSVWTLRRAPGPCAVSTLTLRDAAGAPGPDAARIRAFSGL